MILYQSKAFRPWRFGGIALHGAYSRRRTITVFCVICDSGVHSLRCAGDGNGDDHHRDLSANSLRYASRQLCQRGLYKSSSQSLPSFLVNNHFPRRFYQNSSKSSTCVERSSKNRQKKAMCADCATVSSQNKSTKMWTSSPDDLFGASCLNVPKKRSRSCDVCEFRSSSLRKTLGNEDQAGRRYG